MAANRLPILVVLGATGTGKSKLAIQLAQKFNGQIISADSMQVYKNLDVITNKVTMKEQNQAVHHMISYIEKPWMQHNVIQYRNKALPILNNLLDKNIMPVIVGGTNYYIESLLWEMSLDEDEGGSFQINDNEDLYKNLQNVDPEIAKRFHPNDTRKIKKALQIYYNREKKLSDIYSKQHEISKNSISGPLRFSNVCFIWIKCNQTVLDIRTDNRVEDMIKNGLKEELSQLYTEYLDRKKDYTIGLLQAIGFKEFSEFLALSDEEKNTDKGQILFLNGVENLKLITRRYARKQLKWIRNRFIKRLGDNVPKIYSVDSTDVDKWDENVLTPSIDILNSILNNKSPSQQPETMPLLNNEKIFKTCQYCNEKVFLTTIDWEAHLKSKAHRMYKRKYELNAIDDQSIEKIQKVE